MGDSPDALAFGFYQDNMMRHIRALIIINKGPILLETEKNPPFIKRTAIYVSNSRYQAKCTESRLEDRNLLCVYCSIKLLIL